MSATTATALRAAAGAGLRVAASAATVRLPLPPRPPAPPALLPLLSRTRCIISVRAALAAACITSRLGGLPAPPQMVWRPMAIGSAFSPGSGPKPSTTT